MSSFGSAAPILVVNRVWHNSNVTSRAFSRLLLFFSSFPSDTIELLFPQHTLFLLHTNSFRNEKTSKNRTALKKKVQSMQNGAIVQERERERDFVYVNVFPLQSHVVGARSLRTQ